MYIHGDSEPAHRPTASFLLTSWAVPDAVERRGHGSSAAHLLLGRGAGGGSSSPAFMDFKPQFPFTDLLLAFSMLSNFGDAAKEPSKLLSVAFKAPCE